MIHIQGIYGNDEDSSSVYNITMDGVGADCGPVNPLQSLLKATERDASIQHDSFHSTLPGQLRAGSSSMRTGGSNGHALDEEMRAFHAGSGAKDPFQMEQIQRELLHFQQQRSNGAAPAPANMDAGGAKLQCTGQS